MKTIDVLIALPPVGKDQEGKPHDWDSAYRALGAGPCRDALSDAKRWDQLPLGSPRLRDLEIERLVQSETVAYERERAVAAKRLGMRTTVLDKVVEKRRAGVSHVEHPLPLFQKVEAWPTPVDGASVLDELARKLKDHVVLPGKSADAIALWIALSHAHEAANHSPILGILSPAPRCGKTTLLKIISQVVPSPLSTANIRAAGVFRAIDKFAPTLLIDEADTFLRDSEELRGILNSGHEKRMAYVVRNVGDDHEPRRFGTFCPKVIAMIGFMPATLQDRAIPVVLRRKLANEAVTRLLVDDEAMLGNLCSKLARWAVDHVPDLVGTNPIMPAALNDRASDNWRLMVAIADAVGNDWPKRAREAALELSGESTDEDTATPEVRLLADIRRVFRETRWQSILATTLTLKLRDIDDGPWNEWNRGRGLSPRGVAIMLRPFKINSSHTNGGSEYRKAEFAEAWARYLPADQDDS